MESRRLTWTLGGAGLILCGAIAVLRTVAAGVVVPSLASALVGVIFAASVLLLAVGLSREASVVARQPLGVAALAVLAVWPFVQELLFLRFATTLAVPGLFVLSWAGILIPLAAALVAGLVIARAGTVPPPWNWAPLWALVGAFVLQVAAQLVMVAAAPDAVQGFAGLVIALQAVAYLLGTLVLGVLAVALAARVEVPSAEPVRPRVDELKPQ